MNFSKNVLVISLAFLCSLPILWMLEHSMKYFFFPLQAFLIILIFLELSSNIKVKVTSLYDTHIIFDYLFVIMAFSVLLINIFKVYDPFNYVLSMAVSLIMPGYILSRLMNIRCQGSFITTAALSFALSLAVTGFVSTVVFFAVEERSQMALILSFSYLLLSFLPIAKNQFTDKRTLRNNNKLFHHAFRLVDMLILALLSSLFIFNVMILYPELGLDPGLDPYDYFANSYHINKKSTCLWFEFGLAVVYLLVTPFNDLSFSSTSNFRMLTAYFGIFVLLSFYVMAKKYLRKIDERLPVLATVFFFIFSGFGWVCFLKDKLTNPNLSEIGLLSNAISKTFWDISRNGGICVWGRMRAETVGIVVLFTLLYLLSQNVIRRRVYIFISSILITTLFFVYLPDLVIFVVILGAVAFFLPGIKLRLSDMLVATIIGLATALFTDLTINLVTQQGFWEPIFYIAGLIAVASSLRLLMSRGWKGLPTRIEPKPIQAFMLFSTFLFIGLLVTWSLSFDFVVVYAPICNVPLLLYPTLLGINGLFVLVGISVIAKKHKNKAIALFILFAISALVFFRILSFINTNFFFTSYTERRLIPLLFSACSMVAPITLLEIWRKTSLLAKIKGTVAAKNTKILCCMLLIGFITASGITSTFLTIEYWKYRMDLNSEAGLILDEEEMGALRYLEEKCLQSSEQPSTFVFTVSGGSRQMLDLASTYTPGTQSYPLFNSKYPEEASTILYHPQFWPTYIYMHERDLEILQKEYAEGYFTQHLVKYLPEAYSNSEVKIYRINGSLPVSRSDVALIVPVNPTVENYLFVYDMLSLGRYNYTTMLDCDTNINNKIVIMPFDNAKSIGDLSNYLEDNIIEKIIILNTNGAGSLGNVLFKAENKVSLAINSTDSYLHQIENYSMALTKVDVSRLDNRAEFIVDNDAVYSFEPKIDDNQSLFWVPYACGIADEHGGVAIPELTDSSSVKVRGLNSLKIDVADGPRKKWALYHAYDSPQDWSTYDFFTFYWYGFGDGKDYYFQPVSSNGSFRCVFKDNWNGWKKVILPLKIPLGKYVIGDLAFEMSSHRDARWSEISELFIGVCEGSACAGTWYIDQAGLDVGRWINVEAIIHGILDNEQCVKLSNFNGSAYVPIALLDDSGKIPVETIYFIDGLKSDPLYNTTAGEITVQRSDDICRINMSIKMPPEDYRDSESRGLSQARFRLEFTSKKVNASKIVGKKLELMLPTDIEVTPLNVNEGIEVLGWYNLTDEGQIPFAAKTTINGQEVVYVNVYPLIEMLLSKEEFGRSFFSDLGNLLDLIDLDLPKHDGKPEWTGREDVWVFEEAVLEGTVEAESSSIFFPTQMSPMEITTDDSEECFSDVTSILIEGSNDVNASASYMKTLRGRGFYTRISTNCSMITIRGSNIILSLGFSNGSNIDVNYGPSLVLSINGDHVFSMREPNFIVEGKALFKDAYTWGRSLTDEFRRITSMPISGQDVQISGAIRFTASLSDSFTFATNSAFSGLVKCNPPLVKWSEWEILKETFSPTAWLITFSIFVLFWNIHIRARRLLKRARAKPIPVLTKKPKPDKSEK